MYRSGYNSPNNPSGTTVVHVQNSAPPPSGHTTVHYQNPGYNPGMWGSSTAHYNTHHHGHGHDDYHHVDTCCRIV